MKVIFYFLKVKNGYLNRERFFLIIKEIANKAGLNTQYVSHKIRHAFASHLLSNGADLRVIQTFLSQEPQYYWDIYTHFRWKNDKECPGKSPFCKKRF